MELPPALLALGVVVVIVIVWSAFGSSCTENGQCLQGFRCVGGRCTPSDPTLQDSFGQPALRIRGPRHIVSVSSLK